jgi:hypothetical protein
VGSHAAKKNKTQRGLAYLTIAGGALALSIGGVFAANSITVNSGNAIEFGQGLASTSSCEDALTADIVQAYNVGSDIFVASTITISEINSACVGKNLHVSLIGDEGAVCNVDGTHDSGTNQDVFLIATGQTERTVTIEANCDASTVNKVAITTS